MNLGSVNPYFLTALVILAIAATVQYYLGMKRNRFLASSISRGAEEALKPRSTNYVNIGGAIGHNFAYAMPAGPWTSAKGTMTLTPRQSLLYMPLSKLIVGGDRFYINLFTKRKLRGEGHIVEAGQLRRAKIDGIEAMERREAEAGGRRFVLLWRGAELSKELGAILDAMPDPARLRHFCAYADNKTFFLHTNPIGGNVKDDLAALLPRLEAFFEGKGEA
ncbi:MAG TPA: hypothetical protein PLB91_15550 [Spirochaetales bacterium]|nr:hypothetical protein [Spirochaetales bacterium]HRY56217.1 hypothetical protein [Spirochaetia bacterium]HRZ63460.1 hypothetical protein [Spirochaetia bacterium]